jgi:TM2 domain-containing membrane protein YozV
MVATTGCLGCACLMNAEQTVTTLPSTGSESAFRIPRVAILAFYFGIFGVHRFYTRRPILGILQLITLGGFGFWALLDLILILCGMCKDDQGLPIRSWEVGESQSGKRVLPAFLLCTFLGVFGIHRFYAGKIGTGLLQLVTMGGFGIWAIVDNIMIAWGTFTDGNGQRITRLT